MVEPKKDAGCSFGEMRIPNNNNTFKALQYHIHTFSEHQIKGQGENGFFKAELHVVHQEQVATGEPTFAVFGTMISDEEDDFHDKFDGYLKGFESAQQKVEDECAAETDDLNNDHTKQEVVMCPAIGTTLKSNPGKAVAGGPAFPGGVDGVAANLYELNDPGFGTFTYKGGLTTPGCTEAVNWNLLDTPLQISEDQMERLVRVILCYVLQTKNGDDEIESCVHATLASVFWCTGTRVRAPCIYTYGRDGLVSGIYWS
jgi:hypothetical protein